MESNKVAILQSNYIPWKGVFDMINMVDTFVFFEDVDFTKRDWRTRNKIKTSNGSIWLSVPVVSASRGTKIYEISIDQEQKWQEKHYKTICSYYKKAPFFQEFHPLLEEIYLNNSWKNLSEMNIHTTKLICDALDIKNTVFVNSKDLNTNGSKDDKLLEICQKVGATEYISGPSAKDYIQPEKFKNNNIKLSYIKYSYPEYKQLYGDFDHFVSVLDVLFNCGKEESRNLILQGNIE